MYYYPDNNPKELSAICYPYLTRRIAYTENNNSKFAHYTSAETGLSILRNQSVWLRNATRMNDYSEMKYGEECLLSTWGAPHLGGKLAVILNGFCPGLFDSISDVLDVGFADRLKNTYISSFSEHGDDHKLELRYGRLSMWRAYGGNTSVALFFNKEPFLSDSGPLEAVASPVFYADLAVFQNNFMMLVESLDNNKDYIKRKYMEKASLADLTFYFERMFHFAALSTKHPGFSEEREWRIIYSPNKSESKEISRKQVEIENQTQTIFELPIKNYSENGLDDASIPQSLNKVIIGPTNYPEQIRSEYISVLSDLGVRNAAEKVVISEIPLRR